MTDCLHRDYSHPSITPTSYSTTLINMHLFQFGLGLLSVCVTEGGILFQDSYVEERVCGVCMCVLRVAGEWGAASFRTVSFSFL